MLSSHHHRSQLAFPSGWEQQPEETSKPALLSRSRKESEVFEWSRILTNTRSRSRIFSSTLEVQLDQFLHHTPKLGIPVEMAHIREFLLCLPRFPLSASSYKILDIQTSFVLC